MAREISGLINKGTESTIYRQGASRVYRKHPNQRRSLPILNQSQENPKAALAAWARRQGPKASLLITLLTRPRSLIVSHSARSDWT